MARCLMLKCHFSSIAKNDRLRCKMVLIPQDLLRDFYLYVCVFFKTS